MPQGLAVPYRTIAPIRAAIILGSIAAFISAARVDAQTPTPTATPTVEPAVTAEPTPTSAPLPINALQSEGVAGDIDRHHRSPILTVSTDTNPNGARILADILVPDPTYAKYPVRVEFFVNRNLFASQIRSPELPGPLGVEIPKTAASLPFNYTVVATLIHPNRQFSTVIQGAVFGNTLVKTYDCTLTLTDAEVSTDYIGDNLAASQLSNSAFQLQFSGIDDTGTKEATGTVTVNLIGDGATGTASVEVAGSKEQFAGTGTATKVDDAVESFSLESIDGSQSIACSAN